MEARLTHSGPMEFGIFVQGHLPRRRVERVGSTAEHDAIKNELGLIQVADQHNWKYVWVTEHHFLTEYSHISANEVFMAYAAALTERIHFGSGIFNITPPVNHPARVAERVAMFDHVTEGRFEFGTGRGSSSTEQAGFGIANHAVTQEMYDEVIREFVKMWRAEDYSYDGKFFSMPPRNVLPKPYKLPHPAMWVAAGSPSTYEKAGSRGMGVLGFNVGSVLQLQPNVEAYKAAVASADPVGAFVNDNVMITGTLVCHEDGKRAREIACDMGLGYLQSLVFHKLDTFPKPPEIPDWPALIPEPTMDDIDWRISEGYLICGDPDECAEQLQGYADIGCDQLVFGTPLDMAWDDARNCLRLFGDEVIPRFDTDPIHSTTHYRDAAATGR